MFTKGDRVKSKYSGFEYIIVEPSDRAFRGAHNFWVVMPVNGGPNTQFSTKEIEAV
jgi:hypothetical protein